jgi:hypothetical protein
VWRTRRRWSHASSRCCASSISRKTSSVSGCAAVSLRSANRKCTAHRRSASPARRPPSGDDLGHLVERLASNR